jgi:anthranilate synthase component 1
MQLPTQSEFQAAAAAHDLVALTVPMHCDDETVVSVANRFLAKPELMLLESAAIGGADARYSFVAFDALWVSEPGANSNPVTDLAKKMQGLRFKHVFAAGVPAHVQQQVLVGGPLGYFSYDMASTLEPAVPKHPTRALGLPVARFFMPQTLLVLDHLTSRLYVLRYMRKEDDFAAAERDLSATIAALKQKSSLPPLKVQEAELNFEGFKATFAKDKFLAAAERCLEEIRKGEIFQIQIGNRLSCQTSARPFDIYRHLRSMNPSPYMFYYRFGNDQHILGASPELMVGVQGRTVTHRPIAGTRKRTWDPVRDQALQQELIQSEKERAEHVMLVDLGRNDIGRVAVPGTVQLDELMTVERYSHVFHMVSQVKGELRKEEDAFTAMQASFPNGTVTGAPKIRAMQLIAELEPVAREFYAGSLGMFGLDGNLRSTILIRTIHVHQGVASTQASAGIVYDSNPQHEWLETRNKMRACLLAMQNTR